MKGASAFAGAENSHSDTNSGPNTFPEHKLYWFKCKLNGHILDCLLDSGASVTCIAKQCVTSNPILSQLIQKPYTGPILLDANRKPLSAKYVIRANFIAGTPVLSLDIDMVIVENFPYSCIVGTNLLSKLKHWGIDNTSGTLILNSSIVLISHAPQQNEQINLPKIDREIH